MATVEEALYWARRGFRVFPARVQGKRPAIDDYPNQATVDEDIIRGWWSSGQDYNVALAMGNGRVAIDLDAKGDVQSAIDMYAMVGGTWDTLVNRTPRGGYHLVFDVPPTALYQSTIGLFPQIDVRAEGGYILAPPSYVREEDVDGGYTIERSEPPTCLPDEIAALLKPYVPREQRATNLGSDNPVAIAGYTDYLTRLADPAIEGQGGDKQTYDVACMGVRDYGLTVPTTWRLMLDHYNDRCLPPWDGEELLHKVENADMYAIGEAGSRDQTELVGRMIYNAPAAAPQAPPARPAPGRLDDDTAIPVVPWLVPSLLRKGEVAVIAGPPGAGKSTWICGLHVHLSAGQSYGPFDIDRSYQSFMYNAEDSKTDIAGRVSATCTLHGVNYATVRDKVMIYDREAKLKLAVKSENRIKVPDEVHVFLDQVLTAQPDTEVFSFDPLVALMRGINENDNGEMEEFVGMMTDLAIKFNVALIVGAHMPKGTVDNKLFNPNSVDAIRGASAIGGAARIAYNLIPQRPTDVEIQGQRDDVFSLWNSKVSHGIRGKPTWWQRKSITIKNGQSYPAPLYILSKDIASAHWRVWIDAMGDYMIDHDINEFKIVDAGVMLANLDPDDNRSSKSISNALREFVFRRGDASHRYIDHLGDSYTMHLHTQDDNGRAVTRGQFITLVPLYSAKLLPPLVLPPPPDEDISDLI